MRTDKKIRLFIILTMLLFLVMPAATFALGDTGSESRQPLVYQHGDGVSEDTAPQEGGDGVGFVLGMLAAIVAAVIFVVAIIGAVGLGIIGIGYAQVAGGEE